jgi:hypothetical protein
MLASLPRSAMYIASSVRVLTIRESTKRQRGPTLGAVGRPNPGCREGHDTMNIEVQCRCWVTRLAAGLRPGACGTGLQYSCFNCLFIIATRLIRRSQYYAWTRCRFLYPMTRCEGPRNVAELKFEMYLDTEFLGRG